MPEQAVLWHDCIEDAIGTAVRVLGGPKKVAMFLWPAVAAANPETAYTRLMHCLNPEKKEKLSPSELLLIARKAREAGDNSIMEFLARDLGYELKPLSPAEVKKAAKRAKKLALLDELKRLEEDE